LIFVFDGKTPDFKLKEHQHRRENNEYLEKTAHKLLNDPVTEIDGRKLLVKLIEVSDLMSDLKSVISSMGWEFIDAEFEADQKLAKMCLDKEIDLNDIHCQRNR
jgi:5'-3' exonuclease